MKLTIEKRDLFTVPHGWYLAHCISADFALGAGIAKTFDEIYDMRYKLHLDYADYKYVGGDALLVDNVFNLVTKEKCYQKPTYESLAEALQEMKTWIKVYHVTKLAIPKLGCGLDRLSWDNVKDMIEAIFGDTDLEILVCEL